MRIVRSKKLASLLVLAMLMTMVMVAPVQAADENVKFTSAFSIVDDAAGQTVGWFKITSDDHQITDDAGWYTYVTVDLSEGAEWATEPNTSALVQAMVAHDVAGTDLVAADITYVASDSNTVQFMIMNAGAGLVGPVIFTPGAAAIDIDEGTTGDVTATVTLQALDSGNNQVWSQSATLVLAKVGDGELTATAGTAKKISGAGLGVKVANISIKENQPGILDAATPDQISLTIATSGVTWAAPAGAWAAGPVATGTAGLAATPVGGPIVSADQKTLTYDITTASTGIGGKLTFTLNPAGAGYLNVSPGVTGDIIISVASTNTALADTDLTVATTAAGEFTITPKDVKDREGAPGEAAVTIGDLEIEQNFAGAFEANGSVVFTLKNATWAGALVAPAGFTAGTVYNDDRSIWFSVTGVPATKVLFNLPTIDIDANATGDIEVEVSGTAGPTGTYVVGTVVPAMTVTADKPSVKVNSLDQAAGVIKITENGKNKFDTAGTLKLTLPNGIYFSKSPKLFINGEEVTVTWVAAPKGTATAEIAAATWGTNFSTVKADVIEIKNIAYDVDSRFVSKDISVDISGQLLTGAGGSTKTVASIANAVGESPNAGTASFVIGSSTYVKNGVEYTMDVAPYISGDRTFMPVRFVANSLGVSDNNILWDATAKTVTLIKGDKVVQLKIGSKSMLINGAAITMDVAPEIKSDRTMLPLRFIANAFGAEVTWDAATQTAGLSF